WGKGVVVKVNGTGEDMELDIAFESKGLELEFEAFFYTKLHIINFLQNSDQVLLSKIAFAPH
ncbi:hypothetical protein LZE18_07500, partial [Lactobacillus mulieris]